MYICTYICVSVVFISFIKICPNHKINMVAECQVSRKYRTHKIELGNRTFLFEKTKTCDFRKNVRKKSFHFPSVVINNTNKMFG